MEKINVSLYVGTSGSQKLPLDYAEGTAAFRRAVCTFRRQHNDTDYNIGNVDQTTVRIDVPVHRTNNVVNESSLQITSTGCARQGFTVAPSANATETKLPAFIILKEPTGRIPPPSPFRARNSRYCVSPML